MQFNGVYTAIVTPFTQGGGKIDYAAFEKLVEAQIKAGIDGIVPCGTTGESPTLTHEEHRELIRKTVEIVKKRCLVIAGTGSNSTSEALHMTRNACEDGVDGVLVVSPYYNKPPQDGLYAHFKAIAEASSVPVIVYNIKGRTAVNIEVETMERLAKVKNIAAVKEASGELSQMIRLRCACPNLTVLSGDDNLIPPVMSIGGKGVISVASNIFPAKMKRMMNAYLKNDYAGGNEIFYQMLPFMTALFWDTNPIPVKEACRIRGLCGSDLRLPLVPMEKEKSVKFEAIIKALGADQ